MTRIGSLTMLSRIAGFVRDVLTAGFLGAGPIADAFVVALKLPNLFRRIFAEGAFSAAFVPVYSATLGQDGLAAAQRFAAGMMAILLLSLLPLLLLFSLTMPWIIRLIAPGFINDPLRLMLATDMAQITFPYLLFISLCAFLGGLLNSHGRFSAFAAMPIGFNLALIAAMLFLSPYVPTIGHALSWGVLGAGILQLLWMLYFTWRAGLMPPLVLPKLTPRIRRCLKLMAPGILGAGVVQINLLIDILLASFLPAGSVAFLYYADRLWQLPLSVIGIAVSTALLPLLARQIAAGERDQAQHSFGEAMMLTLMLGLPAAFGLAILASPILQVLFERGAFDAEARLASAAALSAYALGLPAVIMVKTLITAFFAREDMITPVRISIAMLIFNTVLSIILIFPLKHVGIALSTAITAWLHLLILALAARREMPWLDGFQRFRSQLPPILLALVAMVALVLLLRPALLIAITAGSLVGFLALLALVMLAAALYFSLLFMLGLLPYTGWRSLIQARLP